MPAKFITPPLPIWGLTNAGQAEQLLLECFNNSAAARSHGDLVVVDNSVGQMPAAQASITGAVTTTTTTPDAKVLGVISTSGDPSPTAGQPTIPIGNVCFVAVMGNARVNAAGNAVAAGNTLISSATGGAATGAAFPTPAANVGATIGTALEAKDAANTLRALLRPS